MKRYLNLGVSLFLGLMLSSCHKGDTVQADYQPRKAPDAIDHMKVGKYRRAIDGELRGIDTESKSLIMRVDNGMDQTFIWDENTIISMDDATTPDGSIANMAQLAKKTGAELSVQWRDEGGQRFATAVEVKDLPPQNAYKRKQRRKTAVR